MATHGPVPVDEHEYEVSQGKLYIVIAMLMLYLSYESLPPDFSLADNMIAGAFAGIAVIFPNRPSKPFSTFENFQAKVTLGALCDVSC